MFQALTGRDTASVLNLLNMDRKLHGILPWNSLPELVTLTDIQEQRDAALMYVQRIPPTHTALEQHVKSVVFQGGHVWGQIHVTTCASFSGAWEKTDNGLYDPHWTTFPRPTTVGYLRHARKDVVAAASAKGYMHCSQLV